jgi:hypothetical protein
MGLELKMSTSFCPQTDGQTKRVNLVIQQFLRNYVAVDQQDLVDHLELVEFCYNNSNGDGQITNYAHDLGSTRTTFD